MGIKLATDDGGRLVLALFDGRCCHIDPGVGVQLGLRATYMPTATAERNAVVGGFPGPDLRQATRLDSADLVG
jgi:hypothetical protein